MEAIEEDRFPGTLPDTTVLTLHFLRGPEVLSIILGAELSLSHLSEFTGPPQPFMEGMITLIYLNQTKGWLKQENNDNAYPAYRPSIGMIYALK